MTDWPVTLSLQSVVVALIAPGQGSQKPGFLTPWLELPNVSARLRWWSGLLGGEADSLDLIRLGTQADAEEIKDTSKTQPLLVAAGLIAAEQLPIDEVTIVGGHSVGELTAAGITGVLSPENAVALARTRGAAMAAACATEPTGMSAVLGGVTSEVLARIEECGLTPANRNGAGQIVAAGAQSGLAALTANPPSKARVIPLQVAGAFHTQYMANAEQELAEAASGIMAGEPHKLLLSNADGVAVSSGIEVLKRLVAQVTRPVRWDLCQQTLLDLGVTAIIELPPAGTLIGLAKRELKGIELLAVNTPDDLAAAQDVLARHSVQPTGEPSVQFRLVVADTAGTFTPASFAENDTLAAGIQLGEVQTRQGSVALTLKEPGLLVEWLASEGDPVSVGQPLARLYPLGTEGTTSSATKIGHTS